MKRLKLTPNQNLRVQDAYADLSLVFRRIKLNQLDGRSLIVMKMLEESIQHLRTFILFAGK